MHFLSPQQFIYQINFMKFLPRNTTTENQWQNYQQLELIPRFVPNPHTNKFSLIGLTLAWQLLLKAVTYELVDEQQVEYLERCWRLNDLEEKGNTYAKILERLWTLMN